jgi:hypothetical protein
MIEKLYLKSALGGFSLKSFIEHSRKTNNNNDLEYLYFLKHKKLNNLEVYGLDKNKERYSLSFTQINEYMPLKIKIEATELYFTLHDYIYSCLSEISFYGDPEHQEKQLKEIQSRVDQWKEGEEEIHPFEEINKKLNNIKKLNKENHEKIFNEYKKILNGKNFLDEKPLTYFMENKSNSYFVEKLKKDLNICYPKHYYNI